MTEISPEVISPEVAQAQKVRRRALMKENASNLNKELSNPPSGFRLEPYSKRFLAMKHISTGMWNLKGIIRIIAPEKADHSPRWISLKQPKELINGFMQVFKKSYEELVMNIPKKGFSMKEREWTGIYIHEYLVEHVCMYFSPEYAAEISKVLFKIRETEREEMMKNGIDPQLIEDIKNSFNQNVANEIFEHLNVRDEQIKEQEYQIGILEEKVKVRDDLLEINSNPQEREDIINNVITSEKYRRLEAEKFDLQRRLDKYIALRSNLEGDIITLKNENKNLKKDLEEKNALLSKNPEEQQAFQNEEYEKLKNESREEISELQIRVNSLENEVVELTNEIEETNLTIKKKVEKKLEEELCLKWVKYSEEFDYIIDACVDIIHRGRILNISDPEIAANAEGIIYTLNRLKEKRMKERLKLERIERERFERSLNK